MGNSLSSTRRSSSSGHDSINIPIPINNSIPGVIFSHDHASNTGLGENRACPSLEYKYLGKCVHSCEHCGARFRYEERIKDTQRRACPFYHRCCMAGRVVLRSLCPAEEDSPRFLQLYIYDTENEVDNRMTAREKLFDLEVLPFKVRLFNVVGAREYELPIGDTLGAIMYEPGPDADMDFDIIIEQRTGPPQRVNKLHPSYMALQFLLLFVYGEDGYSKDMKIRRVPGASSDEDRRLTMKAYYSYMLHDRINSFNYLSKTGRLFQR
ncbi:hypothetical protein Tco_0845270, partial [Tanacetum coccineum]